MYRLRGSDIEDQYIEDDETLVALDIGDETADECLDCGEYIEDAEDHGEDCGNADWVPSGPATWCNGAGIVVKDNEVRTWISLGDPRGAFTFTVRRLEDGRIIMHTPYPGEGFAHMPLKEDHRGTYIVGEEEKPGDYIEERTARALLEALHFIVNDAEPGEDAVLSVEGYNRACRAIAEAKGYE